MYRLPAQLVDNLKDICAHRELSYTVQKSLNNHSGDYEERVAKANIADTLFSDEQHIKINRLQRLADYYLSGGTTAYLFPKREKRAKLNRWNTNISGKSESFFSGLDLLDRDDNQGKYCYLSGPTFSKLNYFIAMDKMVQCQLKCEKAFLTALEKRNRTYIFGGYNKSIDQLSSVTQHISVPHELRLVGNNLLRVLQNDLSVYEKLTDKQFLYQLERAEKSGWLGRISNISAHPNINETRYKYGPLETVYFNSTERRRRTHLIIN
jgi:hypothetical protein